MRWLVAGAAGMLGQDVVARLRTAGEEVEARGSAELDIRDPAAVGAIADADVIVNCAARTAVDALEGKEAEAFAVNAIGPQLLARAASACGARLVQVSTDYVFSGTRRTPYRHDDALDPLSAYGRSKAAGEWAVRAEGGDHLIVRTAWLYGGAGACFPRTIARLAAGEVPIPVVDDQFGQPTWTVDLADLIIRLVAAGVPGGVYHGTASGQASRYEFARAVVAAGGGDPAIVVRASAGEVPRPAPRPAYSVLSHDSLVRAGVTPIGEWEARWRAAAARVLP